VIDADGRNEQRLTHYSSGADLTPAWSPDGRQIVFAHSPDNTSAPQLYVINTDGAGTRQLTTGSCQELHPSW